MRLKSVNLSGVKLLTTATTVVNTTFNSIFMKYFVLQINIVTVLNECISNNAQIFIESEI